MNRPGFPGDFDLRLVLLPISFLKSGGLLFNFGRRSVVELAVKSLLVEPRHPRARRDLEVVESSPVSTVVGQDCRIAVQLGLEDAHHRFGHGVIETVADRSDRGGHAELVDAVGVAH